MSNYYTGTPGPYSSSFSKFAGTFGFGAWQDQAAYVRNMIATAANGTTIYSNSMTSPDVLSEFGTGPNVGSVCLDAPKRDRLVWLGDFYHTARIIGVSTGRSDLIRSTLEFLLATQIDSGELGISPSMSYDPSAKVLHPSIGTFGLFDYQLLGMSALYSYVRYSNDLGFVKNTWSCWQKQADWIINKVNATGDSLWYAPSAFLGPSQGSAVSCLALQSLSQLAEIAGAIGDKTTQSKCRAAAEILQDAIQRELWNAKGFYSNSPSDPGNFSVAGTSFCITSGASSEDRKSVV